MEEETFELGLERNCTGSSTRGGLWTMTHLASVLARLVSSKFQSSIQATRSGSLD